MFCSAKYDPKKLLEGIRGVIKGPLIGCTTAGEITNGGVATGSVAIMCIESDKIKVGVGVGENISRNAREAGQKVMISAMKNLGEDIRTASQIFIKTPSGRFAALTEYSAIILPDALSGGGADIVRGVMDVVGTTFPTVGGSPGDDLKMEKTYEMSNDDVYSDAVVGAILKSEFATGFGVRHGWQPASEPFIVTKSKGGTIYEINGEPAIKIYEKFFKREIKERELGKEFTIYSLGIPEIEGGYRLRWPIIRNPDGSIVCAAEVPEGSVVRIMRGDEKAMIEAAREAAEEAVQRAGEPEEIVACIVFNCISRKEYLKDKASKEVEAIKKIVGKDTPIIGFETYGEIAPTAGGPLGFHNQTIVVYVISKSTLGELVARTL